MTRNTSRFLYVAASWLTIGFPILLMTGHVACDIALSAIALLFLLHCAVEKNWRWCAEPWVQCLALLWLYIILRGLCAENPLLALRRSLPFARYFVFAAALAYWLLQDNATRHRFLMVLTYVLLFLALDGVLQWVGGKDIIGHPSELNTTGNLRLTGPFRHEMLGIMLAWLYFPVCLKFVMGKTGALQPANKLFAGTAAALLILAVIALSGERMALLLTLLGWGIAVLLLPVRKRILLVILASGLLLLGLLALSNPDIFDRQIRSTLHILEHWQQSPYGLLLASDWQLALQHPVFGIGAGHFSHACEALYAGTPAPEACNTHPHNMYMEWLIEGGMVGLLLFIASLAAVCRMCFASWPDNRLNPVFIGLLIAFVLRIWPLASSTNFFSPWGAPPFWLVLGALLAYTVHRETLLHASTSVTIKNAGV